MIDIAINGTAFTYFVVFLWVAFFAMVATDVIRHAKRKG